MQVRVEYTAQLRAIVGQADECLDLPEGSSLAQLLRQLAQDRHRDVATYLLTPSQELQPSLLIARNRTFVSPRDAHTVIINAGDVITLMPPIAGG